MALVGIGMVQANQIRPLRNRIDGAVFLLTVLAIVFAGLEYGILVGVLASVGFFVASASRVKLSISHEAGQQHIAVTGNLFYASIDGLSDCLRADPTAYTVLDLSRVPYFDSSAAELIETIQRDRVRHGGRLDVAGHAVG